MSARPWCVLLCLLAPAGAAAQDSTQVALPAVESAADSTADSTLIDSTSAPVTPVWNHPWQPMTPSVESNILEWTRPEDFEGSLHWLPGSSIRVAGDTGMDAFVSTSPFSLAPELLVDGVPSRSPADLDPAIWDRGSNMVTAIASTNRGSEAAWGEDAIHATLDSPLVGRTVLESYFTNSAYDTYTRAVGVRTPGTERVLHLDFQEFKTEDGYQYSDSPGVTGDPSNRGRSKQRHFRIGGKAKTSVGELGFDFGRGRRYTRGDVLSANPHERWTGHLSLGLDRADASGAWNARLYHLDFHDDWQNAAGVSLQSIDAARMGLRVERSSRGAGFFGGFNIEQQSARFLPPSSALVDTTYVRTWTSQLGAGWHGAALADWTPWLSAQASLAEHTAEVADWGGRAGLRRRLGSLALQIQGERILRTPTLNETYGAYQKRLVTPTADGFLYEPTLPAWEFSGAGPMNFERQDRAELRLSGDWGNVQAHVAGSLWWLSRGIGWEPTGTRQAGFVSGLETELTMIDAALTWVWVRDKVRLRLLGRGHYLPGTLEQAGGRPAGFPRAAVLGRVGLDRSFFSPRNRIGLDLDVDFLGEHFDDLTAPIGGVVPGVATLNTRAWLGIRDAEIFCALDNVLDQERVEVLGTRRRFQQFRFGLTWNFYN